MKKLIFSFFIIFYLCLNDGLAHIGHKAYFSFSEESELLQLRVKFQKFDLQQVLKNKDDCLDTKDLFFCVENYFQSNFSCLANEKKIAFKSVSFIENEEFYILNFETSKRINEVSELKIKNTCFNDFDEYYSNIIRINAKNKDLTYKMSKKRTEILHKFRSEK